MIVFAFLPIFVALLVALTFIVADILTAKYEASLSSKKRDSLAKVSAAGRQA